MGRDLSDSQGLTHVAKRIPEILEDAKNSLTDPFRRLLYRLSEHLQELHR